MFSDNEPTPITTSTESPVTPEPEPSPRSRRGFASMDPLRRKNVAKKGGLMAHELGKAHRFSSEEARVAGRKGLESRERKRQIPRPNPQED